MNESGTRETRGEHSARISERSDSARAGANRFVSLTVALLLFTAAAILGLSYLVAILQNDLAARQSRTTVEALLEREKEEITRQVLDYAVWDAAYQNLARNYQAAWAAEKLGPYLSAELKIDGSLVLRLDPGSPAQTATAVARFAMLDGRVLTPNEIERADGFADPALIALVQNAAQDRRALPEPQAAYIMLAGRLYMAGASPVTDKARPELATRPGPRTVLIFLRAMNAAWFVNFQRGFSFAGIGFVENTAKDLKPALRKKQAGGDDPKAKRADANRVRPRDPHLSLELRDPLDRSPGSVVWRPPVPGSRLLWILMPAAAAVLALCGAVTYVLLSQWRRLYYSVLAGESEMRLARERAERANQLKSQFLANVSHEIRTPMTAILGHTEVLQDALQTHRDAPPKPETQNAPEPNLEATLEGSLESIERNGRHLLAIINDILDLSHLESGLDLHELRLESIDLRRFLAESLALIEQKAREKSLELACVWEASIPARIESDTLRLRQILINLLGNAIKFTNAGFVRLELTLRPGEGEQQARLEFAVVDSGRGIDLARSENILQAFVQSNTNTANDGGTGLGLAISNRLVQALGATSGIQVESRPGRGSRFAFALPVLINNPGQAPGDTLPPAILRKIVSGETTAAGPAGPSPESAQAPVKAAASSKKQAPDLGHLRVLLADDGQDNRVLLARILQAAEITAHVVENGQAAVEAAQAAVNAGTPFDAILMDMQMPVLDGYQATQKLRADGYVGPIFALTAYAMPEDRKRCLEIGCDEYLSKPISRAALYELLAALPVKTLRDPTQA